MNIFALYTDPRYSAIEQIDAHVVKMTLETAQILSTAAMIRIPDIRERMPTGTFYKPTHVNHGCVRWAASNVRNYNWLISHFQALLTEYTRRFGKRHKCGTMVTTFMEVVEHWVRAESPVTQYYTDRMRVDSVTPFFMAMPEYYKIKLPEEIRESTTISPNMPRIEADRLIQNLRKRFDRVDQRLSHDAGMVLTGTTTFTDQEMREASVWSYRNYYFNEKVGKIKSSGFRTRDRHSMQWVTEFASMAEAVNIAVGPNPENPGAILTKRVHKVSLDNFLRRVLNTRQQRANRIDPNYLRELLDAPFDNVWRGANPITEIPLTNRTWADEFRARQLNLDALADNTVGNLRAQTTATTYVTPLNFRRWDHI